tara:strand:+ start:3939 stop:4436 length:498 start_codon:yes stop_codon:yes gene_type:complete
MSWQHILKMVNVQSSVEVVNSILDFVTGPMNEELGNDDYLHRRGTLSQQQSVNIMRLLKNGAGDEYSQIDDKEGNGVEQVSLELYIDDGFFFTMATPHIAPTFPNHFNFGYVTQGSVYDKLIRKETTPARVAELIQKFLNMIGRPNMEHGMTEDRLIEYLKAREE